MKLITGDIIPRVGIGNIMLNITRDELMDIIGDDFEEEILEHGMIIKIENAKFWFSEDNMLDQIGVGKDYEGKYKNLIGIGSTLNDIKKYIGDYVEVYYTYELKDEKGICFELEDIEDWEELTASIEFIYVFRI